MTDKNIDNFLYFKDTDLVNILPNDIIFEIGKRIFGIYKVETYEFIDTLNEIGIYINELDMSENTNIDAFMYMKFQKLL